MTAHDAGRAAGRTPPGPRRARRALLGAGLLGVALAVAAPSAWGTFSTPEPVELDTSAGVVAVTVADGDSGQAFVDSTMPGLFPGETRERLVDLTIGGVPQSGTLDFQALSLTVAVAAGNLPIVNDPDDGLQLEIERCSTPWDESGGHPATYDATYTCSGTSSTVVARGPVLGTFDLTTDPGDSLVALGDVNHYCFTFDLPTTATAAMQNTGSIPSFTFNGTARAGTDA